MFSKIIDGHFVWLCRPSKYLNNMKRKKKHDGCPSAWRPIAYWSKNSQGKRIRMPNGDVISLQSWYNGEFEGGTQ